MKITTEIAEILECGSSTTAKQGGSKTAAIQNKLSFLRVLCGK